MAQAWDLCHVSWSILWQRQNENLVVVQLQHQQPGHCCTRQDGCLPLDLVM